MIWIILLIGLLALAGLVWFYRDGLKQYWKKNKKKIIAVGAAGAMIGVGSGSMIIPEGYRPRGETLISNSNGKYWSVSSDNLQNAIEDLGTSGGWVSFDGLDIVLNNPSRTLWINESNIVLRGYGGKIEVDVDDPDTINTDLAAMIYITTCENISLLGFEVTMNEIWGDEVWRTGEGQECIWLSHTENVLLRDLYIHNTADCAVEVEWGNFTTIDHCTIEYVGNISETTAVGSPGIRISAPGAPIDGSHNNTVSNCNIQYVREHGIKAYYGAYNNKILNNYIGFTNMGDSDETGNPYGVGIHVQGQNLVDGNTIVMNKLMEYGILCDGESENRSKRGSIITNNHILFNDSSTWQTRSGIKVSLENSTVSNNVIDGYTSAGDHYGVYLASNNCSYEGNVLSNLKYGYYFDNADSNVIVGGSVKDCVTGIIGQGTSYYNTISDVFVSDCSNYGIYLDTHYYLSILGCTVKNVIANWGIRVTAHNSMISNCKVSNIDVQDGIYFYLGDNNTCINNIIDNANDKGIELGGVFDTIVGFNQVRNCGDGIYEIGTCDYNIYVGNSVRFNTANNIQVAGANCNVSANIGTII